MIYEIFNLNNKKIKKKEKNNIIDILSNWFLNEWKNEFDLDCK